MPRLATVHWLRWSDFVPASDQLLRSQIVPQGEKALGIKLNLEMINANDIQARITAAIQSGSGADIIYVIGNWPQLYVESLSPMSATSPRTSAKRKAAITTSPRLDRQ